MSLISYSTQRKLGMRRSRIHSQSVLYVVYHHQLSRILKDIYIYNNNNIERSIKGVHDLSISLLKTEIANDDRRYHKHILAS
jgi:hypothetical protein